MDYHDTDKFMDDSQLIDIDILFVTCKTTLLREIFNFFLFEIEFPYFSDNCTYQ